jgi:O-acetyl-ADP-ribose deacetylase (regulator of RNase III)
MITYLDISLFDSPAQTLVNTVNTVGVMGKGIALIFKQLYPEMYTEYRKLCDEKKFTMGMLYIYRTPNKIVVNFPTKQHWKYPSRLNYLETGLRKFVDRYQDYGISSVSFPQLGCGNGELDWQEQVQPLMERYLRDIPIPVYIHIYPSDPDFVPERRDENYIRQVRLERQRISTSQLWQDLQQLANGKGSKAFQMSLFGPGIEILEETVRIDPGSSSPVIIYREDIEDLWNILRIRGVISEADVPETIRADNAINWLFDLLGRLSYIRPIKIRKRGDLENGQGLQYVPQPETLPIQEIDALV